MADTDYEVADIELPDDSGHLPKGIGGSVVKAEQLKPQDKAQHLMNRADEYIARYQPHSAEDYFSAVEPALARQTPDYYAPPEEKGPPDWLTQYMENQPTTGTIVVDQLGNQRYMNERQRLKALKKLQQR